MDKDDFRVFMNIAEALGDIADALRFTYLQGNEYSNTMRIDNRTGEMWKLTSQWNDNGFTTLVWEPEPVAERQAELEPATERPQVVSPSEPAGAVYACIDCGDSTFAGDDTDQQDKYPACPNCGRTSGVYKQYGGIPAATPTSAPRSADELPF